MKQTVLVTLILFLMSLTVFAQQSKPAATLSEKQWDDLFTALENEDWGKAADYSSEYMREYKNEDQEKSLARLRYMFIFASAGKVIEGTMTYEELEKSLKAFVGQEIMIPHRRIAINCKGQLNTICFNSGSNSDLSAASTNKLGTNIHAIEYVKLQEKFDYTRHEGKLGALGGTINSFQLNPNKSRLWIMRIFVEKGYIVLGE